MVSLPIYNKSGAELGRYEIDPAQLAPKVSQQLLHDVVVMYQANRRLGTHKSKTRSEVAGTTNQLLKEQGQPAAEDLRKAIASVQNAADNLDAVIADARPGIQNFSKSTLPEANRLVRDLRDLSTSLKGFSDRLNEDGIGGSLGAPKLPDYKPGKTK